MAVENGTDSPFKKSSLQSFDGLLLFVESSKSRWLIPFDEEIGDLDRSSELFLVGFVNNDEE